MCLLEIDEDQALEVLKGKIIKKVVTSNLVGEVNGEHEF